MGRKKQKSKNIKNLTVFCDDSGEQFYGVIDRIEGDRRVTLHDVNEPEVQLKGRIRKTFRKRKRLVIGCTVLACRRDFSDDVDVLYIYDDYERIKLIEMKELKPDQLLSQNETNVPFVFDTIEKI